MSGSLDHQLSTVNVENVLQSLYGEERLSAERIRNIEADLGHVAAVFQFESVSKVYPVLAFGIAGTLLFLKNNYIYLLQKLKYPVSDAVAQWSFDLPVS